MKKIVGIIVGIIAIFIIVAVAIYIYYGGLETVTFIEKQQGGEILVYKEVTGDYGQTPDVTNEIYDKLLTDFDIDTAKLVSGFGLFYDNPQIVETAKLRSEVGCILDASELSKIPELEKSFKVKIFPTGIYTSVELPFKGQISIFVSQMKFYMAFAKLVEENPNFYKGGPIMEIYNMRDNLLIYRICPTAQEQVLVRPAILPQKTDSIK